MQRRRVKGKKEEASSISDFQDGYTSLGNPFAYSGINAASRSTGESSKKIKDKLAHIFSYTLHRQYKKPSLYNPFYIYFPREQLQVDLIDVSAMSADNDNVHFLLAAIDCFTKKGWVEPLISKHGVTTRDGLKKIFQKMETKPETIFFDRGKEFVNTHVRHFLKEETVKLLHPNSSKKAAICERFNRSIQDLLYKYLTESQSLRYIDDLGGIVNTYNNRGHRTLKFMSPNDAELKKNEPHVRNALSSYYSKFVATKKRSPKFKVGDVVRIKKERTAFGRGYHEQFKRELFTIAEVDRRMPIITYQIRSNNDGELIQGKFYSNELQEQKGDVFKIEKVLKKRKRKGKEEIYVKWLDFDEQHNSWIPASNIVKEYNN
jgi:hypothetical protein